MTFENDKILSFQPSIKLEKALKISQAEIERLSFDLDKISEDEKSWLHRWALISTVGASTRIENAVLTDAEIEWVDTTLSEKEHPNSFENQKENILNKLSKDRERSIEEVVGCRELLSIVYLQASELFPLRESTVRGLHHTLLSFYPSASYYAGRYKINTNQVVSLNKSTGDKRVVLDPTPPGPQTDTAMKKLIEWYNYTLQEHPWPLLVATEFVFRFLAIHPFQDGNGRMGRALFLMALLQAGDKSLKKIMMLVSIDRHIEQNRFLYYKILQQTSGGVYKSNPKEYHFEPLAWFFLKMLNKSLSDVTFLREKYASLQKLSESADTVLSCFRSSPERRLKLSEIVTETGLVRRTVQNALMSLTKKGFLQRLGAGPGTRYQLVF